MARYANHTLPSVYNLSEFRETFFLLFGPHSKEKLSLLTKTSPKPSTHVSGALLKFQIDRISITDRRSKFQGKFFFHTHGTNYRER